jgi:hypothetical protein
VRIFDKSGAGRSNVDDMTSAYEWYPEDAQRDRRHLSRARAAACPATRPA